MPASIVRGLVVIVIIMVFTFLLFLLAYLLSNFGEESEMTSEYGYRFEGDMVLNKNQVKAMISNASKLTESDFRWRSNVIPYQLSTKHTQKQHDHIEKALRTIEADSCLKFVRRTNESDYIRLSATGKGCFATFGYHGGAQVLNLESDEPGSGCFVLGTIIHEFLHVLGFFHTQHEIIQNDFVKTHWKNASSTKSGRFGSHSSNKLLNDSLEMDYMSIMHRKTDLIGQRDKLSGMDIANINQVYCSQRIMN